VTGEYLVLNKDFPNIKQGSISPTFPAYPLWFKNSLETFFKAILGTDLGQVCKFWGVDLAPEPLKLTSFHGQIDQ